MFAKKSDESKEVNDQVEALRSANCLTYVSPSNIALVDRRVMKSYNFSSAVYPVLDSTTMQIIVNSGGDSLWGPSCYLRFQYTAGSSLDYGLGSVLNCFRSVRATHRSGEILEYVENVNLIANLRMFYEYSVSDFRKLQGVLGYGESTTSYSNVVAAGVEIACIPLSLLFGIFGNKDQYMPASMCAGMKLEFEMAPNALVTVTGKTTPQITNITPTLLLDSAQLYDVVNRELLQEQADIDNSGIQFKYNTFFNTSALTNSSGVNVDVQQSASLTNYVVAITRDNNRVTSLLNGADAFNYIMPWGAGAQFRLGSLYYPQQIVKVEGAAATWNSVAFNSKEWYTLSLMAFQAYIAQFHKAAGYDANIRFQVGSQEVDLTQASWLAGRACNAFSLEKSSCGIELSGESTNNSRILNFNATLTYSVGSGGAFPTSGSVTRDADYNLTTIRVDTFMNYVRVANLMGDNCVVDR